MLRSNCRACLAASSRVVLIGAALAIAGCGGADARKTRHVERGQQFFAVGNFEKARLEFRNALQIEPNNADFYFLSGEAAAKLGNVREAAQMYQGALDSNAKHLRARERLARIHLLAGHADRALEIATPGLKQAPDDAGLLTVRGAARQQKGEEQAALADAEHAVRVAPTEEDTVALLSALYQKAGRSEESIYLVKRALAARTKSVDLRLILAQLMLATGNAAEAQRQLQSVINLEPSKLGHRYRLAQLQLDQKNLGGAEVTLRGASAARPDDPEPQLALANFLAKYRSLDQAETELRHLSETGSGNARLRIALGDFYSTHGRHRQAEEIYRQVIEQAGSESPGITARNRLASLYLAANRASDSERILAQTLELNPRDADALAMRADALMRRGHPSGAIADLRAVLRDQPDSIAMQRMLARAYLQAGDTALAEETLRAIVQANAREIGARLDLANLLFRERRLDQAQPLIEAVLAEKADHSRALESLYRIQVAREDVAGARQTAAKLQEKHPQAPIGFYLAGLLEEKTDTAAARLAFERALALSPQSTEPLAALVRVDIAEGRHAGALKRLQEMETRFPQHAFARNLKGDVHMLQQQSQAATASYRDAIAIAPKWWFPYRGLARAAFVEGRASEAIEALNRGIEATQGSPQLVSDLAMLHERAGRPEEAIRAYELLLRKHPRSDVAVNNLAMALATHRADRKSLDRAAQLVQPFSQSRNPAFLDTYGWVMFKRGDATAATVALQEAVDKAPKAAALRYHLGMVHWKAGREQLARENLRVAVNSGSSFAGVEEARSVLARLERGT